MHCISCLIKTTIGASDATFVVGTLVTATWVNVGTASGTSPATVAGVVPAGEPREPAATLVTQPEY